jgi:hypothetical protein
MHGPINVKSPNNISKWQMGFNLAFKGLIASVSTEKHLQGQQNQGIDELAKYEILK